MHANAHGSADLTGSNAFGSAGESALLLHGGQRRPAESDDGAVLQLGMSRWESPLMVEHGAQATSHHSLSLYAKDRLLQFGCFRSIAAVLWKPASVAVLTPT